MNNRVNSWLRIGTSVLAAAVFTMTAAFAQAADTIKVGVLHSLSGTMAISETTLKDTVLMMIDEQNKKGGLLGKKLEAVVVDPASNWPLFAEKAKELLEKEKELGSLQIGKIADIIAVKGNPLSDISILENVVFVMKDGTIYKGKE